MAISGNSSSMRRRNSSSSSSTRVLSSNPIRRTNTRAASASTVAAAGAVLNALADAIGDDIIRRTPVQPEQILTALAKTGKMPNLLQAFI